MLISTAWIETLRRGRYAAQLCQHVDDVARMNPAKPSPSCADEGLVVLLRS